MYALATPEYFAAVVLAQVVALSGFTLLHPAGGKPVASNPSKKGMLTPERFAVNAEDAVSLAGSVSLPPLGKVVYALNVCAPPVTVTDGSVTVVEPAVFKLPVQANVEGVLASIL